MTRVAVVGPGRVGTALALALPPPYRVVAVAGRGDRGVTEFCLRLPEARPLPLAQATAHAEVVLVCVPDDELANVARVAARDRGVAETSRWVHTAGGEGLRVLRPVRLAGASVAACHPAQTFPDPETGAAALRGTAWAVTAGDADMGWAGQLVRDLGGIPVPVAEQARVRYHAALVVASNATAALVTLARELLLGSAVEEPAAFLTPLVQASVANAARSGAAALTGPVRRGDAGTVRRHLDELHRTMPEALEAYTAVSRLALRYARRAGLDAPAADAVADVLERAEDTWRS